MKAPLFLKKYFWDIDFKKLDPQKRPEYVIERILELGDVRAVRWVFRNFKKEVIKKAIMTRRGLSPKTANFWATFFNIPHEEIVCFRKGFPNPPKQIWSY